MASRPFQGTVLIALFLFVGLGSSRHVPDGPPSHSHDGDFHPNSRSMRRENIRRRDINWNKMAHDDIRKSLKNLPQFGIAKNVILFLGDGMGLSDITSTRFLLAERHKKNVEEIELSFETFPFHGLSKTHTSDRKTADSAGAATAILCGEKANFYTVGVKDSVPLYDCTNLNEETKLKSLLVQSMEEGKWTGLVTNTRITHATPSAAYAHSADRNGEAVMPEDTISRENCEDIAQQLIHGDGKDIRVILGGGRKNMLDRSMADISGDDKKGKREDGKNLIEDWIKMKKNGDLRHRYVTNKTDFDNVDIENTDYLLGLFNYDHMKYEHDRKQEEPLMEPSLSEMVEKALGILQRNTEHGYFLFVEGGLIDRAHHRNLAYRALDETISFAEAVQVAMELTNEEDTLIVVTADHSHVFNLAGYPDIDTPLLGTYMSAWEPGDGMPFTPVSYTNGPGFNLHHHDEDGNVVQRMNLTGVDTTDPDYIFDAGMPNDDETHAGEEVAIHARGPMAYLFQGIHQQHYIAHAIRYASCVGPDTNVCDEPPVQGTTTTPSSGAIVPGKLTALLWLMLIFSALWTEL